ncbi:5510_t:CDS:1 [Racocetra persica]|uniref:5510_t:CDS:1 n=1 Tax=Racocetra persica TaxID=160502 RepID=A0ACA9PY45_9GLOM|nr:5510_t:CDS:1 [Racocetra persica]
MSINNDSTCKEQYVSFSMPNTEHLADRPKVLKRRKTPYVWGDKLNPAFDDDDEGWQDINDTSSDNNSKDKIESCGNMGRKNMGERGDNEMDENFKDGGNLRMKK